MVIGRGKTHVRLTIHRRGRRDVENGKMAHPFSMVARQTVRHTPAAVMSGHHETFMAKCGHQPRHVSGHGAL